ncbi:hypothetical protein [Cytobacillus firmus]|uniref:hypothetical protein n=1 Tax=Cytobacillus firmus TaxID=1399 RepID=UPI003001311A
MKKMKKALLGTALAGTLVIGAGAGTYSWFNASYTAGGEITNHTLTINGDTEAYESLDFGNKKLAPSRVVEDSFSFKNTGSMDQILRATLDLALYDGNTNVGVPDKSMYTITAQAYYNGSPVGQPVTGNAQTIDNWFASNDWFPSENGAGNLPPGAQIKVDLKVKLLENAGNEYQGKTLKGGLTVEARQTDTGSEF